MTSPPSQPSPTPSSGSDDLRAGLALGPALGATLLATAPDAVWWAGFSSGNAPPIRYSALKQTPACTRHPRSRSRRSQ